MKTGQLLRPQHLDDALEALRDEDTIAIAGGVSLAIMMRLGFVTPRRLVDLNRIADLRGISRTDAELRLGALVTHAEVETDPHVRALVPELAGCFRSIGNLRVRAWGTVGGNLAHADPAQDPPVMLAALGAQVDIAGAAGTRTVPASQIADGPFSPAFGEDEVITAVRIPLPGPGTRMVYEKFLPGTADDYATVSLAARIDLEDGVVTAAAISAGSVGPTAITPEEVDRALVGRPLDRDAILGCADAMREAVRPATDRRGSADYKRAMVATLTERALERCARKER